MKIVFLDSDTLPRAIERPSWATQWINHPATAQNTEAVVAAIGQAEICLTNKVRITQDILDQCPQLRFICVTATGFDCIDLQACARRNVIVSNVPGYSKQSVAESVIGYIFALRRHLMSYARIGVQSWSQAAHFCVHDQPILDVRHSTLSILGQGAIGSEVARLAQALGMTVLFAEHRASQTVRPGYTEFDAALAQSDIISLHCPLTPATEGLIGRAQIAQLKPGALIINTARGPLVDEAALIEGLGSGRIGGAALDVLAQEPPSATNALLKLGHPNLIITPHIAWAATEGQRLLVQGIEANLQAFHDGQAINVVNASLSR
jgi:glycerate dehydrogenase